MIRSVRAGLVSATALAWLLLGAAGATSADDDETFGGLPEGKGREETFYACTPCHSIRMVVQQGLSRDSWKEVLEWMVEKQEMEPLEPEEFVLVLDYLATHLNTDHRPPPPLNR